MTQQGGAQPSHSIAPTATASPRPEPQAAQIVLEHVTPTRAAIRRFRRHRLALVGLVIVITVIILAICAPLLTDWPPNKIDFVTGSRQPPSALHPLGTDVSGRDVWSRL